MTSSLIRNLNESVRQQAEAVQSEIQLKENATKKEALDTFKEAITTRAQVVITFDTASPNGDLSAIDNKGIVYILKNTDLKDAMPYYESSIKSKFLATEIICRVQSVDEVQGVVYLVSGRDRNYSVTGAIIAQCSKMLKKNEEAIEKGEKPEPVVVFGRITYIDKTDSFAYVDVLCRGVVGRVSNKFMLPTFCRHISSVCKKGDILEFEVSYVVPRKGDRVPQLMLSRKNIATNPWDLVRGTVPEPDSVIICKVVEDPEGKSYYWAESSRYPGIEIIMNRPTNGKLFIKPGISYKCKVKQVDVDNTVFKVSPFEVAEESNEIVRFINRKRR